MKITPAYLRWKRAGSPGNVWCLLCDRIAEPDHVHGPPPEAKPESGVLALMRHLGLPQTRETYIALNFMGDYGPHDELPAELEAELPSQFRRTALENPISDKEQ